MPLLRARMERPDGSCVVPGVRASLGQLDECWGDGGANQSVADPAGYGTAEESARTDVSAYTPSRRAGGSAVTIVRTTYRPKRTPKHKTPVAIPMRIVTAKTPSFVMQKVSITRAGRALHCQRVEEMRWRGRRIGCENGRSQGSDGYPGMTRLGGQFGRDAANLEVSRY
jgi:hypothetical protein